MSIERAQDELDFIIAFEAHCKRLIETVSHWERHHQSIIEESGNGPDRDELKQFVAYNATYELEKGEVNLRLVRFRELVKRYGVLFEEVWLYKVPCDGQSSRRGEHYRFSYSADVKNALYMQLTMVRGAATQYLLEEKKKAGLPWLIKRKGDIVAVAAWVDKNGHSKYFIIGLLIIVVAGCLHLFGFDLKSIVEILKLVGS